MTDLISLATKLVQKFGINLLCNEGHDSFGSYIDIRPADLAVTEGFTIRVRVGWRSIESEFIPGNFAAKLIHSMGKASSEKRLLFRYILNTPKESANHIEMKINDLPVNPLEYSEWPENWTSLSLVIRKTPVAIDEADSEKIEEMIFTCGGQLLGLLLSILPFEEMELQDIPTGFPEGAKVRVEVNRYERNHLNRAACIEAHGTKCSICGFDFAEYYGEIGREYIHVHHIVPVSQLGENYIIDPVTDLRPICPNCHAMLHRKDPPYTLEKLQDIIDNLR